MIDLNYVVNTLEDLLNIPSPSGNTHKAIKFIENEFSKMNLKTHYTNKGALLSTLDGQDNTKEITISAHIDTLGGMVKEISSDGKIKMTQIGGYAWNSVEGEYVTIETLEGDTFTGTILTTKASVHVHGSETSTIERNENNMFIRLDEKIHKADDVKKLGINIGDFVYFDPRVEITKSGFIKSRHLDDKAGVAIILGIAKYFMDNKISPKYKTNFFISNYEEVGHGASACIPKNTCEFLAIDMAAPGDGQESDEYSVTICAKDSTGPYDYNFRKKLTKLARNNNISYKIDIYPSYGSDASAALRAGHDIRTALIGPGVDASHSYERTHIDAIENTIKLAIAYLSN